MPRHVETKICRDCGTEFALRQTERYAVRCPICRRRHAGAVHVHTAPEDEGGGVLRTEVRGHLWTPSRWPKPGRSPDDGERPPQGERKADG